MTDNPPPQQTDNSLTSEHYEAFCAALDVLYIPGNLSGRLNFLQQYPPAGAYIFGAQLIAFDTEGTADKDARAALEQQATARHAQLQDLAHTLEDNSVKKGVLQTEYVESTIKELGRDLALLLYAPRFVDQALPPPSPAEESAPPKGPTTYAALLEQTGENGH